MTTAPSAPSHSLAIGLLQERIKAEQAKFREAVKAADGLAGEWARRNAEARAAEQNVADLQASLAFLASIEIGRGEPDPVE